MRYRITPLAVLAGVLAFFAAGAEAADDECRLQSERECLTALEELAALAPLHRSFEQDFFAVLVNGDTSELHNGNIERAYRVLRTLGVPDENIYILSNTDPRPELRRHDPPLVTAQATRKSLSNVLGYLRGEVDRNDCVLLYTTGHGIRDNGQSALCLNDGLMGESELVRQLKPIESAVTTVVMDQCFSGGFADALERSLDNVVAMTNTDGHHDTYCEYFAAAFWMSLLEADTDLNGDGRVTFAESYDVAMAIHRMALSETPERTQGRFVTMRNSGNPGVALSERCLRWTVEPSHDVRTRVIAKNEDEGRFRRSRSLAGHRFGYRP